MTGRTLTQKTRKLGRGSSPCFEIPCQQQNSIKFSCQPQTMKESARLPLKLSLLCGPRHCRGGVVGC